MIDYGLFDALLDSIFVINTEKAIVYCNEAGAELAESSVKRLTRGKLFYDIFQIEDQSLFMTKDGEVGRDTPVPMTEVNYKLSSGKEGAFQVSIRPFEIPSGEKHWILVIRDVTLEEVLAGKYRAELEQKEDVIVELRKAQQELEAYSKNLEAMVEERTAEVKSANKMLNAIMNSLGQGFLTFDRSGQCSNIFTKACEDILESAPLGKKIWDVLGLGTTDRQQFTMWMQAVFDESLPFDSLKGLAPNTYNHTLNRFITLDYFAIRKGQESDSTIENLVVVATDKTTEHETNIALEREKLYAKMIIKLVLHKKQFNQFLSSVENYFDLLTTLSKAAHFDHRETFRILHTLEGEAGAFSVEEIRQAARGCQEVIEPLKSGDASYAKVVDSYKEQLKILRQTHQNFMQTNQELFNSIGLYDDHIEINADELDRFLEKVQSAGISAELCEGFRQELMKQPIERVFAHYADTVKNVANKQGKKVVLTVNGSGIKLVTDEYDELFSVMVHAFRNAVDHGIEMPEERLEYKKPAEGHILVDVCELQESSGPTLKIIIKDDGKGIDPDMIRRRLREKASNVDISQLNDQQVIQHIFDAGFSSRDEISEFSGRGVGMDAVKHSAEKLGGSVWIESQRGKGTTLTIQVPFLRNLIRQRAA